MILGVDPGKSAGAALVDGQDVVAWWAWTRVRAGFRLRTSFGDSRTPDMHSIGCVIRSSARRFADTRGEDNGQIRVVLEGLYVSQARGRTAAGKRIGTLACAELAGEILGPLRGLGQVSRPTYSQWTCPLGHAGLRAAAAGSLCVQEATRRFSWPKSLRALTMVEEQAVCEAVLMTLWAGLPKTG